MCIDLLNEFVIPFESQVIIPKIERCVIMEKIFHRKTVFMLVILCFFALPLFLFTALGSGNDDDTEQTEAILSANTFERDLKEFYPDVNDEFLSVDDLSEPDHDNIGNNVDIGVGFAPQSATSEFISHTRSDERISYGSHSTSYYTANGNIAFCLDPDLLGLETGNFPLSRHIERNDGYDLLIKGAYYLYGGPGYDSIKHSLFIDPDDPVSYGYSHATLAFIWSNDASKAFIGLPFETQQHLHNVITMINTFPMPPSGFRVFLYNEGSSTYQTFLGWEFEPNGGLEIRKVSSNSNMSSNNPLYSLAGAVFDVFNGSNQRIGRITTGSNGRGRLEDISLDQTGLYIVEVTPPPGYAINSDRIDFEIVSEQTTTVTVSNRPQNGVPGIVLRKRDANTSGAAPQGSASLAGAEFTVRYYAGLFGNASQLENVNPARTWVLRTNAVGEVSLNQSHFVSGDPFFLASNGVPTLPLGTVTIQETKPPEGYLINDELFIRQITSDGVIEQVNTYSAPTVPEVVIRGGVDIEKWDIEFDRAGVPQGDATLAGAVFDIWNRSENSVIINGSTYAPNAVVHTMTTDANGRATTTNTLFPYGTYEIVERAPPHGYLTTGVTRQTFQIRQNGVIVNLRTSNTAIKNDIIRGGVYIEKWDAQLERAGLSQGDAKLEGAVFDIWNRSVNNVVVNGSTHAPNTVVHTMTTDVNGCATTTNRLLPYGTYEVVERTPPLGYSNTGAIRQTFQIRQHGIIINLNTANTVIKNDIIRGGIYVEKWDNEIGANITQGGGTLAGAVFEIVNRNERAVLVEGEVFDTGMVVYTLTTDSEGTAQTTNDLLPYGIYEIREISPPYYGYLSTGVLSRIFEIREPGVIVTLNSAETAIRNDPIRGDLRGVKVSDGDTHRMGNIRFSVTSVTTGESHVIVTDVNGEFSTASSWNPHSQNTNRGESDRDGVWFGELDCLDDNLGALLFDTYVIEELRSENNEDRALLRFEVTVNRHSHVINLGTLTNAFAPTPEVDTTARDSETTVNSGFVSESSTVIDTIYYSGLQAGKWYTLKGLLMDKDTGEPLLIDDDEVTAERTFRAFADAGAVTMDFTFNSLSLEDKQVVVFQYLYQDDTLIASHNDIDDENQTVTFRAPEPEPEPIPDPDPEPGPDPDPDPEPDPIPNPDPDPDPNPAPEPEPDSIPAPTPEGVKLSSSRIFSNPQTGRDGLPNWLLFACILATTGAALVLTVHTLKRRLNDSAMPR